MAYPKTYKTDKGVYEIPEKEAASFLKDFPNAMEVVSYKMGKDTFDIPVKETEVFLKENPQAVPLKKKEQSDNGLQEPLDGGLDGTISTNKEPISTIELYKTPSGGLVDDPFTRVKKSKDLSQRKRMAAIPSSGKAGEVFTEVPDEGSIKEAENITSELEGEGFGKDFIEAVSDMPEAAFRNPTTSKETLINLYGNNPVKFKQLTNEAKIKYAIQDAAAQKSYNELEGDKQRDEIAKNTGILEGNKYSGDERMPESMQQFYDIVRQKQELINKNIDDPEQKKKYQGLLRQTYAPAISPESLDFKEEYQQSGLSGTIDINQYAGLKTLELFEPEKYKTYLNVVQDKIVPQWNVNVQTSPEGQTRGIVTDSLLAEKLGGQLSQLTINQRIGKEEVLRELSLMGANNEYDDLTSQQNDLKQLYKDAETDEQRVSIIAKSIENENRMKQLEQVELENDKKYPLTAKLKYENQVKEIVDDRGMGVGGFMYNRYAHGVGTGVDAVENLVTNILGSEADKTKLRMKRIGEGKQFEADTYLPESERRVGSPVIVQASDELKKKAKEIINGRSLSSLSDEERQQLNNLIANNQSQIKTITNPEAGKSKNFLSKATGLSIAGFTADIGAFLTKMGMLQGVGLGAKASEATTLFTDGYDAAYNKKIAEGASSEDAHEYGILHGAVLSLMTKFGSKYETIMNTVKGGKSPLSKYIAGLSEKQWNKLAGEAEPLLKRVGKTVKGVAKEQGKMIGTFGVAAPTAASIADNVFYDENKSVEQIAKEGYESAKEMLIGSVGFIGLGMVKGSMKSKATPLEKIALWELGDNPELGIARIDEAVKKNEITAEEGTQRKEIIERVSKLIPQVPETNDKGKVLNDQQRIDYLYRLALKESYKEKSKTLPEKQSGEAKQKALVIDKENQIELEGLTEKQANDRKDKLEKAISKVDDKGKPELSDKEMADAKAELEAINNTIEKRKDTSIKEEELPDLSQPIPELNVDNKGIPIGENVPPEVKGEPEKISQPIELSTETTTQTSTAQGGLPKIKEQFDIYHEFNNPDIKVQDADLKGKGEFKRGVKELEDNTGEDVARTIANVSDLSITENIYGLSGEKDLSKYEEEIKSGIQTPITVEFNGESFDVMDGHHRLEAYKKLGYKEVPIVVNESGDFYLSAKKLGIDVSKLNEMSGKEIEQIRIDIKKAKEQSLSKQESGVNPEIKNEEAKVTKDTVTPTKDIGEQPVVSEGVPKTETGEGDKKGITHAAVTELRKLIDLPEYEGKPTEGHEQLIAEAQETISKDPEAASKVLEKIDNNREVSNKDNAILAVYKATLDKALEENPTKETLERTTKLAKSLDVSGTKLGKALESRKLIGEEDNLANFLMQKQAAQGTALTENQVKDEAAKYTELKAAKEALEKQLEQEREQHARDIAELGVNKAKAKAKREAKKSDEEYKAERKASVDAARDALKKLREGGLKSTIPGALELQAIAPHVKDFFNSLASQGVDKLDNIITQVHAEFKDVLDGLTKKNILDIVAGDFDQKKEKTKNEKAANIRLLKREVDLLKELERTRKWEEKTKSETEKIASNRRIDELKKKIEEVQKLHKEKEDIEPVEDLSAGSIEDVAKYEAKLQRRIEKLNNDLKEGNYLKEPAKQPIFKKTRKAQILEDRVIDLENKIRHERSKDEYNKRSATKRAFDKVMEVLGIRRLVQSAVDISVPFRQGATMLSPRKIDVWAKGFKANLQSVFSPKKFERIMYEIRHDQQYHEMLKDNVVFNDLGSADPNLHNEDFRKSFIYDIPIISEPLKASNRSADAFLNVARYEMYKKLRRNLEAKGFTREADPKAFKYIGNWVMSMTGRGKMHSALEKPAMNAVLGNTFYGARLMASRFNLLNPVTYFDPRIPKEVRYEAMKDMAAFTTTMITVATALSYATGAKISTNPDDSDFLQLRYDDKVYDISGGLANYVRTGLRIAKAGYTKATGTKYEGKEATKNAGQSVLNFFRNKLSPNTAYGVDAFFGGRYGEGFDPSDIYKIYPMYTDDFLKAIKEEGGVMATSTVLIPNILGIGYGSYASKGQIDKNLDDLLKRNLRSDEMNNEKIYNYNEGGRAVTLDEFEKFADKRDAEIEKDIKVLYKKGVSGTKYEDLTPEQVADEIKYIKATATRQVKEELFGKQKKSRSDKKEQKNLTKEREEKYKEN